MLSKAPFSKKEFEKIAQHQDLCPIFIQEEFPICFIHKDFSILFSFDFEFSNEYGKVTAQGIIPEDLVLDLKETGTKVLAGNISKMLEEHYTIFKPQIIPGPETKANVGPQPRLEFAVGNSIQDYVSQIDCLTPIAFVIFLEILSRYKRLQQEKCAVNPQQIKPGL